MRSLFDKLIQEEDNPLLVAQLGGEVAGYIWARIAKAQRITQIQLDYWAFNDSAAAFFSKRGYTPFNLLAWKNL